MGDAKKWNPLEENFDCKQQTQKANQEMTASDAEVAPQCPSV